MQKFAQFLSRYIQILFLDDPHNFAISLFIHYFDVLRTFQPLLVVHWVLQTLGATYFLPEQ